LEEIPMLKRLLVPMFIATLAALAPSGCTDNSGNGNFGKTDATSSDTGGASDGGTDTTTTADAGADTTTGADGATDGGTPADGAATDTGGNSDAVPSDGLQPDGGAGN
jgi:hypothetical protein